jgi:hypothetical protein
MPQSIQILERIDRKPVLSANTVTIIGIGL